MTEANPEANPTSTCVHCLEHLAPDTHIYVRSRLQGEVREFYLHHGCIGEYFND